MKRKRFTKSDRQWCYALLTLIKNAAKTNLTAPGTRRSKSRKNEKSNLCYSAGEVPQLIDFFLRSRNAENIGRLLGNSKDRNSLGNRKRKNAADPAVRSVSFAGNTKGCGDKCPKKHYDSHSSHLNYSKRNERDTASNSYEEQRRMRRNMNFYLLQKRLGSLSEYLSMQALISRLNELKSNSQKTDANEDQGSIKIDDNNLMKSSGPNGSSKKNKIPYELNKNSVRKIPFGFLTQIKDVVPGGVDGMVGRHTRGKVLSSETICSEELGVASRSPTAVCFMNEIETGDQVNGNLPEDKIEVNVSNPVAQKPDNIEVKKSSNVQMNIVKNCRDIKSSVGENYKRISLVLLEKNITLSKSGQVDEGSDEFGTNDSFEDLQKIIEGKRHIITADVDGKRTQLLKNDYYIERMKLPETNGNISKRYESIKKHTVDKADIVANFTKWKKRGWAEEKIKVKRGGCDCYLKSAFKDRELYLNSLGQCPNVSCHS